LLALKKTSISKVIALNVLEEELIKRLLKRGETSGRSDDTNEEVIRKRFLVYKNETEPVADYYKQQDKFEAIEGIGTVDEIFSALSTLIQAEMAQQSVSTQ
jgi:adenylate kinase